MFLPYVKTPFTEFDTVINTQTVLKPGNEFCANILLRYLDCLEAYGVDKAKKKCAEYMYDAVECSHSAFQERRTTAVEKERMRQYRAGKLAKPYEEPENIDAYFYYY